uniref:Uncharacterized protein n=1 Tax=Arundo donax TaxID=35708 RepID=A0A0A9CZ38_ARUDO
MSIWHTSLQCHYIYTPTHTPLHIYTPTVCISTLILTSDPPKFDLVYLLRSIYVRNICALNWIAQLVVQSIYECTFCYRPAKGSYFRKENPLTTFLKVLLPMENTNQYRGTIPWQQAHLKDLLAKDK